jgi:hypothetical protein
MQKVRINTTVGGDKKVIIELKQNFELMEILSLKLTQKDVYTSLCSDYGVVCGRVSINNGLGVPNAKVSILVPLSEDDADDPVISALYPYNSVNDRSEEGYKYNLLPERQQHSGHEPTGSFPDQLDIISREEVLEVFEKYYKFTVKTNDYGDFMIWGVPVGEQLLHVDIDLSDIKCFSLRPDDFLVNGYGIGQFKSKYEFKSSSDITSLPQIKSFDRTIEVYPFWGGEDLCKIGITRTDFDLSELGVKIEPKAYLIGGTYTDIEDKYIRKNGIFKSKMGHKINLTTKTGKIELIRFTSAIDEDGRPILERLKTAYDIEEDGSFYIPLPMNMEYLSTNEFGDNVYSNDPTKGIPTASCYRLRVTLTDDGTDISSASYLIPNIRDYKTDPDKAGYIAPTSEDYEYLTGENKSYAFSTAYGDYPDKAVDRLILNSVDGKYVPQDYFYRFTYNKVYTVTSFHGSYYNPSLFVEDGYLGIKNLLPTEDEDVNDVLTPPINFGTKHDKFSNIWMEITLMFEFATQSALMSFYTVIVSFLFYLANSTIVTILGTWLKDYLKKTAYKMMENTQTKYRLITYPECQECGETSEDELVEIGSIGTTTYCIAGYLHVVGSSDENNRILTDVTFNPETTPIELPCSTSRHPTDIIEFNLEQSVDYAYSISGSAETILTNFDNENYIKYDESLSGYTFIDDYMQLLENKEYVLIIYDKRVKLSEPTGKHYALESGCEGYNEVYDTSIINGYADYGDHSSIILSDILDNPLIENYGDGDYALTSHYVLNTQSGLTEFYEGVFYVVPGTYTPKRLRKILLEYIRRKRIASLFCNGAVNYSFIDNWLAGSLYLYRFKFKKKQDEETTTVKHCNDLIAYVERDDKFYYRSTSFVDNPDEDDIMYQYDGDWGEIIKKTDRYRLGNPTTIVDLGARDNFIKEICVNTQLIDDCAVARSIGSSSYKDIGELMGAYINYKMAISNGTIPLYMFFNNQGFKISGMGSILAGDIMQLISINNEAGIAEFDINSTRYAGYMLSPRTNPTIYQSGGIYGPFPVTFSLSDDGKRIRECLNAPGNLDNSAQHVPFFAWEKGGTGFGPYDGGKDNQHWDNSQDGIALKPIQGMSYFYIDSNNNQYLLLPMTYDLSNTFLATGDTESIVVEFDVVSNTDNHLAYSTEYPGFTYLYTTGDTINPTSGTIYIKSSGDTWHDAIIGWTNEYPLIIRESIDYYNTVDPTRQLLSTPFLFYFGLRPGKTGLDKFIEKFGDDNAFPSIE